MKKVLSVLLSLMLILSLCAFTTVDGLGSVYKSVTQKIGPSAIYTNIIGTNTNSGGVVNAYTVEADVTSGVIKPYVYNGQVRGAKTLTKMTSAIASEGYKVVAGINGDLYDTSSGTPKGASVHKGNLVTGGYQSEYVLSFDRDGRGSISQPKLTYSINMKLTDGEGGSTDSTATIGYFNVPHGGANALHLYNYNYADTTHTSGTCAEAVLTINEGSKAELKAGGSVTATVTSVNNSTNSTKIEPNQFVLSANNQSAYYGKICQMIEGSTVTITANVTGDKDIIGATEAMGVYNVMALDGVIQTTDKTLNPRTAIGLKDDGTVVLYVVDGRQTNVSNGMNAVDVTKYLMSKGCTSVVNMDGGGSTTMVARSTPGKSDDAVLVNSPSGGSERMVSNGLFFVYTGSGSSEANGIAVYPVGTTMMPGMSVKLSSYGVNSYFEQAALTDPVTYSVNSGSGSVSADGTFTAAMTSGKTTITATSGSVSGTLDIDVVSDVSFTVNKSSVSLEPGESVDLNVDSVKYGPVPVLCKDELFSWTCSPSSIGSITSSGVFMANSNLDSSATGNIVVTFGDKKVTVPVKVTVSGGFSDISDHWAKTYIIKLTKLGIISGMGDGTFAPNASLTRAQFLTLLSKVDKDENMNVSTQSNFKDVKSGDWYAKVVSWGVQNRIVNGYTDGTFGPNKKVTREQMCVMLYNYYIHKSKAWNAPDKELTFNDVKKISDYALPAVKKVVNKGVMSGRPDGSFDPLGNATRAEAAKIIYMIL